MPDDRFFHKRAGHSEKVNQLTDFEELIWRYYVLSADDFGVMKFSPDKLRADHERAATKPVKAVQRALERVLGIGLVHRFEHQGRGYIYSRNWQQYQKVDYPRDTIEPMPPAAELAACQVETARLFGYHPGGKFGREIRKLVAEGLTIESARVRLLNDESVDEYLRFTRAGALAKAQANGQSPGTRPTDDRTTRVQRFVDHYRDLHQHYVGVAYLGNAQKDYQAACELVEAFDDPMLEAIAVYGLNDLDPFMTNGTRTITKLKSRASDYAHALKARKLA
jgi:hypothetical protein